MKYFKIDVKRSYDNNMFSCYAEGEKIPDVEFYFNKISQGEILLKPPVFDYFYLKNFDEKKYWEWILCDVHKFIGEGSQIKGWLISNDLKLLLENFKLSKPYYFYPSKLMYKEKKINYYIFQFTGKEVVNKNINYINFSKTLFWNPMKEQEISIIDEKEFYVTYRRIYKENGLDNVMKNKKLVLKEELDFYSMQMFMKDNIISERLKQAIEEDNITGFEFSELDYEVIVDKT